MVGAVAGDDAEVLPSAADVSFLLVAMRIAFDTDHGRATTRFRVSMRSLRRLSARPLLSDAFRNDVIFELARLGYGAMVHEDHLAIVEGDAIAGWVKISSERVADALDGLNRGDLQTLKTLKACVQGDRATRSVKRRKKKM